MQDYLKNISFEEYIPGPPGPEGKPGKDSTVPGPQGEKGDKGERGDKGDRGDRGDRGDDGKDSTIPGPQGKGGDNGSPDTPDEIVYKLQTIKRPWLSIDSIVGDFGSRVIRAANNFYDKRIASLIDVDLDNVPIVNGKYTFSSSNTNVDYLQFNTTATPVTNAEGLLQWNATDGTLDLGMDGGDITLQIGQEMFTKVRNVSGSTIPNGSLVYFNGRTGNRPNIYLARGNVEATAKVVGMATTDIAHNSDGFITTMGYVRQIDTRGVDEGETWADGDVLWTSKTLAGHATNVEPSAPHHSDKIGYVGVAGNVGIGSILLDIDMHLSLEELSDVNGTALTTTGQFPVWNQTAGYFDFNHNISEFGGGSGWTVATPTGTVNSSNASFTVTAVPKCVISDGMTYFDGAGYTYAALSITLDIPPSSFIRYFY